MYLSDYIKTNWKKTCPNIFSYSVLSIIIILLSGKSTTGFISAPVQK